MSKKRYFLLTLIALFVLFAAVFYISIQQYPVHENILNSTITNSPLPDNQSSNSLVSTVSAERTAIAIFTQNPTFALSSTPFYAEILYNEWLRSYTEVAPPDRRLTETACVTVGFTWSLSDLSYEMMDLLIEHGVDTMVSVVSTGVSTCNISFEAVRSFLYITPSIEKNGTDFADLSVRILDFLSEYWDKMERVSDNAQINICFSEGSDNTFKCVKSLVTSYKVFIQAYERNLRGDALLEALGGLVESE